MADGPVNNKRILIVIGDPALDDVEQSTSLRSRFTTILRHALGSWSISDIYFTAQDAGPERWLAEFLRALNATYAVREFPKGRFEFGPMRNNRMVAAIQTELDEGARAMVLYFQGPLLGTSSTQDLARKCESIKVKVITLSWNPKDEESVAHVSVALPQQILASTA